MLVKPLPLCYLINTLFSIEIDQKDLCSPSDHSFGIHIGVARGVELQKNK